MQATPVYLALSPAPTRNVGLAVGRIEGDSTAQVGENLLDLADLCVD